MSDFIVVNEVHCTPPKPKQYVEHVKLDAPSRTIDEFLSTHVTQDIADVVEGFSLAGFFKTGAIFLDGQDERDYAVRLIDGSVPNVYVYSESKYRLQLLLCVSSLSLSLAALEFAFKDDCLTIKQPQGVHSTTYQYLRERGEGYYDTQRLLAPLKWRHALMSAAYELAKAMYPACGVSSDRVYVVPAHLNKWLDSRISPRECPFDIRRAKLVIDRPARDVGFRDKDETGLLYKLVDPK